MASAGDVNGDGFQDFIVAAEGNSNAGRFNAGAAYVVFGGPALGTVDLDDVAAGVGGFKIIGELPRDGAGNSVSSAGDVNGDGFADVILGAQLNDAGVPLGVPRADRLGAASITTLSSPRLGILHGSELMHLDQDLAFGWDPPWWNASLDERRTRGTSGDAG